MILTPAILFKEKLICNEIFRKYTDYHLNAVNYGLVTQEKYFGGSMYLDCLVSLLNAYSVDIDNNATIGPIDVLGADVVKVIDRIHHFDTEEISVSIANSGSGSGSGSGVGTVSKYEELPSGGETVHNISISAGYVLKQVYLNGILLSNNDWTYVGNVFTYTGEESLDNADWFLLHFEK
jgi:hypothetical protein